MLSVAKKLMVGILALGLGMFGSAQMATADPALTPGVQGPITITGTVPDLSVSPFGPAFTFGTAANEYQMLTLDLQLVLKTAAASPPSPSWFWTTDSTNFAKPSPTYPFFCTSTYDCQRSGLFSFSAMHSGTPVSFTPRYFAFGSNYLNINLSTDAAPAAGTVGLVAGDTFSLTIKGDFLQFPANVADYEFRWIYEAVQLGTGAHGPATVAAASGAGPATSTPADAPTAVAGAGSATVTVSEVTPAPASYVVTASPQVAGVTKSCRITSTPPLYCQVTGLTPGVEYTFTTQVTPLGGIASSPSVASNAVTPTALPTVTSISPAVGSIAGGTQVTIHGTSFAAGALVFFGSGSCTDVTVVSDTEITCTTPATAASSKDVGVYNTDGGYGYLSQGYKFVEMPTISDIEPATGSTAGGTSITVTGTGFVPAGLTVTIGGQPCVVTQSTSTSITCTAPPGTSGTADIEVTNSDGGSALDPAAYTYLVAPTGGQLAYTGSSLGSYPIAALLLVAFGLFMVRAGKSRKSVSK